MKASKFLLMLLLALTWVMNAHAQGFVIDTFHVRIDLSRDGYFDVTEEIFVTFSESKHGIYRTIPYKYPWNDSIFGERALNRGEVGSVYETPIVNIDVPGHDFTASPEGLSQKIKIGSSTKFVNGKVHYTIRYRVYGAINQFSDHDEFYWNITGNEWEVNIEYTSFDIRLPGPLSEQLANARSWTGAKGTTTSGAVFRFHGDHITGFCPSRLLPSHGVTLGFSMPKGYLANLPIPASVMAENYSIKNWESHWKLETNGSWLVRERFTVDIRNAQASFHRTIPADVSSTLIEDYGIPSGMRGMELIEAHEIGRDETQMLVIKQMQGVHPQFEYQFTNRGGSFNFTLEYRVWPGSTTANARGTLHYWEPVGMLLEEPVEKALFTIEVPGGFQESDSFGFSRIMNGVSHPELALVNGRLQFSASNILPSEVIEGKLLLKGQRVQPEPAPLRAFGTNYFFTRYDVTVTLQPDGVVNLQRDFEMQSNGLIGDYFERVKTRFPMSGGETHSLPKHGILRQQVKLRETEMIPVDGTMSAIRIGDEQELLWTLTANDYRKRKHGGSSVVLYDLLTRAPEGGWEILFPIVPQLPEPTDSFRFRMQLPEIPDGQLPSVRGQLLVMRDGHLTGEVIPLRMEDGILTAGPIGVMGGSGVVLNVLLPAGSIHKSLSDQLPLIIDNNRFLLLPLVLLLILTPIWFFLGRDKDEVTMVQFYPPDGITPTEAGLLIDDKLHNRDLLALVYYWAHQGLLKIEVDDADPSSTKVTLVKIKNLPKTAKTFERTIFNGFFKSTLQGNNRVQLSSLKYTFYDKMVKARKEVESHAMLHKFYVPGTRAWSTLIKLAAWVFLAFSLVSIASLWFSFDYVERGRWEVPVGYLATWGVLWFFGRKMVKRGPFGAATYNKLVGFREFIEKADRDKLARLLEKDYHYFEHTLSYAIAFGMANKWVEKFDDLMATAPDWYKSHHHDEGVPFNAERMNQELSRMLILMSTSLNSTPPKSTGSGSTWTNTGSGGGFSRGSSSFGGGGGSYSRGGSSGGGFGGGGGGSW